MMDFKPFLTKEPHAEEDLLKCYLAMAYYACDKHLAIAVPNYASAKDLMHRLMEIHVTVPKWLTPEITRKLKDRVEFNNGSRIFIFSRPNHSRGRSLNAIALSTSLPNIEEWLQHVLPSIHGHGKLIYFS